MNEFVGRFGLVVRGHGTTFDMWVLLGMLFSAIGFAFTVIAGLEPTWRVWLPAFCGQVWALGIFLVARHRPDWMS